MFLTTKEDKSQGPAGGGRKGSRDRDDAGKRWKVRDGCLYLEAKEISSQKEGATHAQLCSKAGYRTGLRKGLICSVSRWIG